MLTLRHLALLIVLALALGSCSPAPGTPEWCTKLKEKPKGDWTASEAQQFAKSCIL